MSRCRSRLEGVLAVLVGMVSLASIASAVEFRQLQLRTRDLVVDPVRGLLYASVPGTVPVTGNSIIVIDPVAGTTGASVFVGSEPGKLAIDAGGSVLYVALDGAAAVRRVDLATLTPDLPFALGSDAFFGPRFAEDIAIMPGSPGTVAVSRRFEGVDPRHAGVAIYDDGAPRSQTTADHTGSNVIEFSDDPGRLYGYDNESSESGFRRMTVDATGVSVLDVTANLISGPCDIEFDGGIVYFTSGRAVSPEPPILAGTFPGVTAGASVASDAAANRVYFLQDGALLVFDRTSFVSQDTIPVPGVSGSAGSLVRWGTDGLAFRTDGDQVFLVRTSVSPSTTTQTTTTTLPPLGYVSADAAQTSPPTLVVTCRLNDAAARRGAHCEAIGESDLSKLVTAGSPGVRDVAVTHRVRRRMNRAGRAQLRLALNRVGRRALKTRGSLAVDVMVTISERGGASQTNELLVTLAR